MDTRELYQAVILSHYQSPRHSTLIIPYTHQAALYNPVCGDKIELRVLIQDKKIMNVGYSNAGCAISIAAASMMSELLFHLTDEQANALVQSFLNFFKNSNAALPSTLAVFEHVKDFPTRIQCVTLCWQALDTILKNKNQNFGNIENHEHHHH